MDLKAKNGESFHEFVIRILSNPKDYGLTRNEAYSKLLQVELSDCEFRKRSYLAKDIQNMIDDGSYLMFMDKETKLENINSFYKEKDDDEVDAFEYEILLKENQRLRKSNQNYQDKLRILRKEDRSEHRASNIADNMLDNIYKEFSKVEYREVPNVKVFKKSDKEAILFLSDLHFGQEVDLPINKFNFEIADKRLNILVDKTLVDLKNNNIDTLTIVLGGDLSHLDHRLDQLLTSEVNRARSFVKAFDLLCDVYDRFLNEGINLKTCSVLGNESRLKSNEHFSSTDKIASDNVDYMLYQMLKRRYYNVDFLNEGDCLEYMFNIKGKNIIVVHGNNLKHNNLTDSTNKLKQRFFHQTGIWADTVLVGHIHSLLITHEYIRNASLVGANSYSEKQLNIPNSGVYQVLCIVDEDIKAYGINCREED